jgi:Aminoacyl-tRNA editing domain
MHPNCEAVNHILETAGLPGRVRMLNEAVTTARAAAQHLGCPVGAIANSLIFSTDGGEPLLIMTSGAHRVDMTKVGDRLGLSCVVAHGISYANTPVSRLVASLQSGTRNRFARSWIVRSLTSMSSGLRVVFRTRSSR